MSSLQQILQEGLGFHKRGLLQEAEQRYRRILSVQSNHGWAHHFLAAVAQECDHHEAAIQHFAESTKVMPNNAAAFNGIGRSFFALGKNQEAKEALEYAISLDSNQANFYNNLGNVLFVEEDFALAQKQFLLAVERNPSLVEAWCNLGRSQCACLLYKEAQQSFDRALLLHPEHCETLSNVGMVFEELGDLEKARRSYEKALIVAPENTDCLYNFAQFVHKRGEVKRAKELYHQLIESKRDHEQSYVQLSSLCDDIDERLQVLLDGVRSNPQSALIGLTLAQFYNQLEAPKKAEQICTQLLEHHPCNTSIVLERVRALLGLHRFRVAREVLESVQDTSRLYYRCWVGVHRANGEIEEAIRTVQEGLQHHPKNTDGYNALGVLYAESGDFERARMAYRDALQLEPNNTAVQRHLSLIKGLDHVEADRLKKTFYDSEHTASDRIHAGFALASILDKQGAFEEAASVLKESNRLHRKTFSYSIVHAEKRMGHIKECFVKWDQAPLPDSWDGPTPIFIMGLPRSGSTLTEQILSTHSQVFGAGEVRFLFDILEEYGTYPDCLQRLAQDDLLAIRTAYLAKLKALSSKPFVVDKFLNNVHLLGFARILFPSAPILVMKRHPFDNGLSMYQRLFTQGQLYCYDLEELGIYINHHRSLLAFWTDHCVFHSISYEALVENPKERIHELVQACGVEFEEGLLQFYQTERSIRTASLYQVRQPISNRSVGKWNNYRVLLTPLIEAIEEGRVLPLFRDVVAELINMGAAFAQSKRYEQAIVLYEDALEINPEHPQGLLNWMYSSIAHGALTEVKEKLSQLTETADYCFVRGIVHEKSSEVEEAKVAYFRAISLNSAHLDARFNLALMHTNEGSFDHAQQQYEEILRQDPSHIEAQLGLGGVWIAQQDYEKALERYEYVFLNEEHPISLHAEHELWPHALEWGILYRLLEQYTKAERVFCDFVSLDPKNTIAQFQLGVLYEEIGALEKAEQHYVRVLEAERENHTIHTSLGTLYKGMGRYEDAERYFIEALKREPHRTSAHNNLGNLYNTLGDFTKAEASYRRALKEVPHFYDAHRHLAQVKKFRDVLDPDIVTMEKELKQEELPVQKKMQLSFALGKAYDDIGISERAFAHLLIGNMHKRERFSFSMDREERKCDALISYFSEPLPKEKGHPSDQPIFILGMPRSGTSLCEQILATHSQVYGGGELSAMGKVKKQIQRSTSDGFPFGLSEMHERECRALGELYLEYLQKVGKGRFITDKMPNNFMMVGLIRTILPNAKIIYCRRDPRDNGLSLFLRYFIGYHGYAYNLEEIASYLVMQNRLMKHWMNIFGEHIFVLDYEEMVADQEKTTERLLRYCDLSYEPALAEFYKTKRGVATASAMQVRTPIYRSSVGKWKRYESELKPMLDILKQAGLC